MVNFIFLFPMTESPIVGDMIPVSAEQVAQKLSQKTVKQNTEKIENNGVVSPIAEKVEDVKEVKVEAPAEAGEKKEIKTEEKPSRKKFKDIAKPFSLEKKEVKEVDETPLPDTWKKKFDDLQKENETYKTKLSNYDLDFLDSLANSGKDIFDLIDEARASSPDKLTLEQLREMQLKAQGIEGEELEEAMYDFENLKSYEKKAIVNPFRDSLKKDEGSIKADVISRIKKSAESNMAAQRQMEEQRMKLMQKTSKEIEDICSAWVGQEHMAVTGTPQMAESIKNLILNNDLIRKNEDGSLNAQDLFDFAHFKLFKDLMFENLENQAYSDGFNELKKEVEVTGGATIKNVRTSQGKSYSPKQVFDYTMENIKQVQ